MIEFSVSIYKKTLCSEHRKMYIILIDINYFIQMYINDCVSVLANIADRLTQKLIKVSKRNFILRLLRDRFSLKSDQKLVGLKI